MKKVCYLLDAFKVQFLAHIADKTIPIRHLRLRKNASHRGGFEVSCRGGELEIIGGDDLDLCYGLTQSLTALLSGHIEEYIGIRRPRCSVRALWVTGGVACHVSPSLSITLPVALAHSHDLSHVKIWAQRVIELGYNTVFFGEGIPSEAPLSPSHCAAVLEELRAYGLHPGLRISLSNSNCRCPLDSKYRQEIQDAMHALETHGLTPDLLFWESQLLHSSFQDSLLVKDALLADTIQAEVDLLESVLPEACKLVYYMPTKDVEHAQECAENLLGLSHHVGNSTILAFPSVAGDAHHSHLEPHPVWDLMRRISDPSSTPLLPILNMGALEQGRGLWPVLPWNSLERCADVIGRPPFIGITALTESIPQANGFLACSLWLAAQVAWTHSSPARLAETWFDAYRPDLQYRAHFDGLSLAREIASELSRLMAAKSTPVKGPPKIELLVAKLRLLDHLYPQDTEEPVLGNLTFSDYFRYFCRDAWCLMYWHLDRLRLPSPGVSSTVDHQGGFWTSINPHGGRSIPGSSTVTPLELPRFLANDSRMAMIFQEIS